MTASAETSSPPPVTGELTKDERIHLINRRTVAFLLEVAVIEVAVVPIVAVVMFLTLGDANLVWWLHLAVWAPYLLVRDLFGGVSWGKRVVGLEVVGAHGEDPGVERRIRRNVVLAVPFMPVVEFLVAFYGSPNMTRIGDVLAKTRIQPRDPATVKGRYELRLVLAIVLMVASGWVAGKLMPVYYRAFAGITAPQSAPAADTSVTTMDDPLGYSITFAGSATLLQEDEPAVALNGKIKTLQSRLYRLSAGGVLVLVVTDFDKKALAGTTLQELHAFVKSSMPAPFEPVIRRALNDGDFDIVGRRKKDGRHLHLRIAFAGHRLYQVGGFWDGDAKPKGIANAIDNLRLTAKAPKGEIVSLLKPSADATP